MKWMKCFISFYLAGGKLMPEIHIRQPGSTIVLVVHWRNTKKEYKTLKKQEIQDIFNKGS